MAKANTKTTAAKEAGILETLETQTKQRGRQVPKPTLTKTQQTAFSKIEKTSDKIRFLASAFDHDIKQNNCTSRIAELCDVRYQHARNVLTQPLKRPIAKAQKAERAAKEKATAKTTTTKAASKKTAATSKSKATVS